MKVYNFLALLSVINLVSVSVGLSETRQFAPLTSENLVPFEKSVLTKYQGQTVYSLRDIKTGKELIR